MDQFDYFDLASVMRNYETLATDRERIDFLERVIIHLKKHNKTAVATFAHFLTGRSQQNMREAHYEAIGGTFSDQIVKAVAEQFEKMGLSKVATDVRQKFTKL